MKTMWRIGVRAPSTTIGARAGGVPTVATTRPGSTELRPTTSTATSAAAARLLHTIRCTPGTLPGGPAERAGDPVAETLERARVGGGVSGVELCHGERPRPLVAEDGRERREGRGQGHAD